MKNKLSDLNNHNFAQLERLGEEGLSPRTHRGRGKRTSAILQVADQIKANEDLQLKAAKLFHNYSCEQVNGSVPEGHVLECLDGNRCNTDASNLTALTRGLLPRLNDG